MWSGPRNLSTALMRSWGSRADTYVTDEPFYAHYLSQVDVDHPGREQVLASQNNDWREVASWLTGEIPLGRPIWYQKHMAQHYLPGMEGDWFKHLRHAFLLRDPKAVVASFAKVVAQPSLHDTGFPQLLALYQRAADLSGRPPAVVDSADILRQPEATLRQLCAALAVPFDHAMLRWAPGRRDTDGVWAPYWYATVEQSTGFQPYVERSIELPPRLQAVYEDCLPYYRQLSEFQLRPANSDNAI
ncbi:MAG: branched chain amino acid aminotransferase [Wenzhouxiangellaceae bacterium]